MAIEKPYLDVPGTTIFDADQSRRGYWLNQFCVSLMRAANRERFKSDEVAYLDEWAMTAEQKQAVLDRDMNRMIGLGGNIYFIAKIGATDGKSFQQMASSMTGMTEQEYRDMMLAGGRSPDGNRYVSEWELEADDDGGDGDGADGSSSGGTSGDTARHDGSAGNTGGGALPAGHDVAATAGSSRRDGSTGSRSL